MDVIVQRAANSIGYPFATDFNYSELYPLLGYSLNNIGDPFIESTYKVSSRALEREVLAFFAELFRAPKDNWWGYATNGGSEGNLYGLYVARELYSRAIVYYSTSSHYSVPKSIHLLGMQSIIIRTQANGEMDYEDLEASIKSNRQRPVIVVANVGTTMTEAKDNVATIRQLLKDTAINSYYIHCDAALAGNYLPLLEEDPTFDFAHGADSIACSGHKFIGSPMPCGVVIVRKNYKDRIGQPVPYIGSLDSTITGSRNGHGPLFLWYAIKKYGREGLVQRAVESVSLASYTQSRLQAAGIPAWRNRNAITLVFPEPALSIRAKWQLATEAGQSHLICMPGVSKETIDHFVDEISIVPSKKDAEESGEYMLSYLTNWMPNIRTIT